MKETKLEKYGDPNFVNFEKNKKTKLERYGDASFNNRPKNIETCLNKYGIRNGGGSKQALFKIKKAWENKSDDNLADIINRRQNTCIERFGVPHPAQNEEIFKKSRKRYTYKNEQYDSSWEIALFIYCEDNNITIKRNTLGFEYVDSENKKRLFFPDFIMNDQLIEIKGDHLKYVFNNKFNEKIKICKENNIKVLFFEDMKPYLSYIKEKYGSSYLRTFKNK